jgi:hypothetical protein
VKVRVKVGGPERVLQELAEETEGVATKDHKDHRENSFENYVLFCGKNTFAAFADFA